MFNVVLVLDLSQPSSLQTITGAVASIISRNFPFRFGIVPLADTEDGELSFIFTCVHCQGSSRSSPRREDGTAFLPLGADVWPAADYGVLEEGSVLFRSLSFVGDIFGRL